MNDRYRTDQTGSTRKSAASAKPKRAAGETAGSPKKKSASGGKRSIWKVEQTEEMRKWRRIWWVLIVVALGLAALGIPLQNHSPWREIVLGLYGVFLAAALYLEFVPLRK